MKERLQEDGTLDRQREIHFGHTRGVSRIGSHTFLGKMRRTLVWYLVYRVKNTGYHMSPLAKPDRWGHKTYDAQRVNHSIRFFPQFVLESREFKKAYLDRVIPVAVPYIQRREDPNTKLYNSVQISARTLEISTERMLRSIATS